MAVIPIVLCLTLPGQASPPSKTVLENGKKVYEEYCAACHGFDGVKQIPQAPSFARGDSLQKKDADLLKTIRLGKGDLMQPWKDDLKEQEMKAALAYIRTIHKKAGKSE